MTDNRHPSQWQAPKRERLPEIHRRADWRVLKRWRRAERLAMVLKVSKIAGVWIITLAVTVACAAVAYAAVAWVIHR